jgi:hypothetical protein
MYAYGEVNIERPGVRALPKTALTYSGGKAFLWRYENGKAVRTEIQTGSTDGQWIEVTNRRLKSESADTSSIQEEQWVPIDPSQQVLTGSKLSVLTDGAPVRLARAGSPAESGESKNTKPEAAGGG